MAVEIEFSICEAIDCRSVDFREITEEYAEENNPTGWGLPNEEITDAISAVLILTSPTGVTYPSIDLLSLGFPRINENEQVTILPSDLNEDLTMIEDGFWTITYIVTTELETYRRSKTIFFWANINKLVCEALLDLSFEDCTCDPDKVDRVLQLKAYVLALEYAVQTANTESVNKIFALLKKLIDCSICK